MAGAVALILAQLWGGAALPQVGNPDNLKLVKVRTLLRRRTYVVRSCLFHWRREAGARQLLARAFAGHEDGGELDCGIGEGAEGGLVAIEVGGIFDGAVMVDLAPVVIE
jgi:hypothetical protein